MTGTTLIPFLLVVLLRPPDDLAAFLAALDKERAQGATPEALIRKIDAWAEGKPDGVRARLAWNRGLLESTIRIDALFVEGLKRRIGKPVTLGRTSGVVKEVKADRLVLGVPGGTMEVEFSSIPYDVRLDDIKKEELLPARSAEEAIFRFAAGRAVSNVAAAKALPAEEQERALASIAGWVLQETDKALAAGPLLKAAEEFAATWAKQPELLAAGGGALRSFIDADLAPKLVAEADAILGKDRKGARKLLGLAASLCKAEEIAAKVAERRWSVLDKGEWMAIPLESLALDGGKLNGKAVAFEDTTPEPEKVTGLKIKSLGIPWEEISGVRAQVKPVKGDNVDMRFSMGESYQVSVAVHVKDSYAFCVQYESMKGRIAPDSSKKVTKKGAAFELAVAWDGRKWKFSVSGTELDTIQVPGAPDEIGFVAGNGSAELVGLHVRKK